MSTYQTFTSSWKFRKLNDDIGFLVVSNSPNFLQLKKEIEEVLEKYEAYKFLDMIHIDLTKDERRKNEYIQEISQDS